MVIRHIAVYINGATIGMRIDMESSCMYIIIHWTSVTSTLCCTDVLYTLYTWCTVLTIPLAIWYPKQVNLFWWQWPSFLLLGLEGRVQSVSLSEQHLCHSPWWLGPKIRSNVSILCMARHTYMMPYHYCNAVQYKLHLLKNVVDCHQNSIGHITNSQYSVLASS